VRILIVGHDAERQGAPILLLRWVSGLAQAPNLKADLEFLVGRPGPLCRDYGALGPVRVLDPLDQTPRIVGRFINRLLGAGGRRVLWDSRIRRALAGRRYDLVWANTITGGDIARRVVPPGVPRVLAVHETAEGIRRLLPSGIPLSDLGDRFIAVSESVRTLLTGGHGIDPTRVALIPGVVPGDGSRPERRAARRQLRITDGEKIVLACGRGTPEKGFDLVAPFLKALCARPALRQARLLWLGKVERDVAQGLERELRAVGLQARVELAGEVEDPAAFYAAADVLWLPSRFESFSLAMIEAAVYGVPTVTWSGVGGPEEFVDSTTGRVASTRDPETMAAEVAELAENPAIRDRLGRAGRQRVLERYTMNHQRGRLIAELEKLSGRGSDTRPDTRSMPPAT